MKRAFVPEGGSMGTCGSRLRCEERLSDLGYPPSPAAGHDAQGRNCSPLLPAPTSPGADGPAALSSGASGVASASARAGPWAGAWPAPPAAACATARAPCCGAAVLAPATVAAAAAGPTAVGSASQCATPGASAAPAAAEMAPLSGVGGVAAAEAGRAWGGGGGGVAAGPPGSAVWQMIRSELDAQSQLEREERQRSAQAWQGAQCCACSTGGCAQHQATGSPPFVHGANSAASAAGTHNYGGPGACEARRRAAWFGGGIGGGWAAPAGPCPGGPRRLLVGWMAELAAAAALQPGTLFGAVSLLDRWVPGAQPPPPGPLLQLMGLAAVWVAGKVEEVYPLSPAQLLPLALDAATGAQLYTLADLARAEVLLLASPHIAWRARTPTPLDFLDLFLTAAEEEDGAGAAAAPEEEEPGAGAACSCCQAEQDPSPSSPQPARAASPPASEHGASWAACPSFACPAPTMPNAATTAAGCFAAGYSTRAAGAHTPAACTTATTAGHWDELHALATQLLVRSLVAGGPALACRHPAALALGALGAAEGPGPAWGGARGGGGVVRALLARAAALGLPRERLAPGL